MQKVKYKYTVIRAGVPYNDDKVIMFTETSVFPLTDDETLKDNIRDALDNAFGGNPDIIDYALLYIVSKETIE